MTDEETLADVDHTHPYTDRSFGETQTFTRGRTVAADGGDAESSDETADDEPEAETETMGDVDHTPLRDAPSANAAYDDTDGSNV